MTLPSDNTPRSALWQPLDAHQRRVLGVLIEKAKTTPAGYPMTVNAIVAGCNQKNNREPLTAYDDIDVEKALDQLRLMEAVAEIDWMGRAVKYKHRAYDWLGVTRVELAVLGELLLRGEQTLGDLRARAARMEPIEDLTALKPIVDGLVTRGLIVELSPPGRGRLVSHGLYHAPELGELRARVGGGFVSGWSSDGIATIGLEPTPPRLPAGPGAAPAPPADAALARLAALETEVTALRAEVAALRAEVAESRTRLRPPE